jgi:hypothetical protein
MLDLGGLGFETRAFSVKRGIEQPLNEFHFERRFDLHQCFIA